MGHGTGSATCFEQQRCCGGGTVWKEAAERLMEYERSSEVGNGQVNRNLKGHDKD